MASTRKLRHQLKGIILEGTGRAVPQLKGIGIAFHRGQITGLAAEGLTISRAGGFSEEVLRVVGQIFVDDGSCHRRIVQLAQCLHIHLRKAFRYEQTALVGQALCDCFRGSHFAVLVSGTEKFHRCRSFFAVERPSTWPRRAVAAEALCPSFSHRHFLLFRAKSTLYNMYHPAPAVKRDDFCHVKSHRFIALPFVLWR